MRLTSLIPAVLLTLAAAFFCHRFYGIYFPIDGDVPQNLYFRFHENLIAADHNPYHWYYASFLPVTGIQNPFIQTISVLTSFWPLSPLARALAVNMLTSWVLLSVLAISTFAFFRGRGATSAASTFGAVVVSFTGFHLAGVRQFDHFYLLSFAAVPPVLHCFLNIAAGKNIRLFTCLGGFWIGISLLGGSDVPLFMYLPVFCLAPLFSADARARGKELWRRLAANGVAATFGIVAGAASLLPGVAYLSETNRAQLAFNDPQTTAVPIFGKIAALFLRAWMASPRYRIAQVDLYLGLPVLVLAAVGVADAFRERGRRATLVDRTMLATLVAALFFLGLDVFPAWLGKPFTYFFEWLSIRFSHRFFMMLVLPAAYFGVRALDNFSSRRFWKFALVGVTGEVGLLAVYVFPNWTQLLPEMRYSAWASLGLGAAALVFAGRQKTGWVTALVYGMFLFAPIQKTPFETFFMANPQMMMAANEPTPFLKWLGFGWNYSAAVREAERFLTKAPRGLSASETLSGRILGPTFGLDKQATYFAPFTGHRFAFTNLRDPASSRRMRTLAELNSPAILDLNNVCFAARNGQSLQDSPDNVEYVRRPGCLPEAFVVEGTKRFTSEKAELEWMARASTEDFLKNVAIDCSQADCGRLPPENDAVAGGRATVESSPAGQFVVRVNSPRAGLLFLSTLHRFDWRARVNGEPAPLYRGDFAFLTVPVPAGSSVVELTLDNRVRLAGIGISFFVLLVLGFSSRRFSKEVRHSDQISQNDRGVADAGTGRPRSRRKMS